jgi:NOL1/NOP2/fmu family ribosome biogenesis protein
LLTFASEIETREIVAYMSERFGIPAETLADFSFLRGKRTIWIVPDSPELDGIFQELRVESAGIPLLREMTAGWKPTTAGLHFLGQKATRNVIELNDEELATFLKRGLIRRVFPAERGYVIVRYNGSVLGCGFYGGDVLRSQIPEERLRPLKRKPQVPINPLASGS